MEFCRIAPDVIFGKDVKIHAYVNLYGCCIGDNTMIGAFVEIQKGVQVGNNCKISSHSFICEGVIIGNNVFIGHNVTFINDKYPKAINNDGNLQNEDDWKVIPTMIEDDASVGSSVTILCGIKIGKGALIGAGSVVTKNVSAYEIWAGNPARFIREVKES